MHTYICLSREVCPSSQRFLSEGFCPGVFWMKGFIRGGFCPFPLLSEYTLYNRKLNITFNFKFHMYEKFEKGDVTCPWTPPPVTNCHTFSNHLPSLVWRTLWTAPWCQIEVGLMTAKASANSNVGTQTPGAQTPGAQIPGLPGPERPGAQASCSPIGDWDISARSRRVLYNYSWKIVTWTSCAVLHRP